MTERVAGYLCQKSGVSYTKYMPHSENWYSQWMRIQDSYPYATKGGASLDSVTRKELYDESPFDPDTRQQFCDDQTTYTDRLKDVVVANKGKLKESCFINIEPERKTKFNCLTEQGLGDFFRTKLLAYIRISVEDSNRDKKKYPSLLPSDNCPTSAGIAAWNGRVCVLAPEHEEDFD